jgi:hypothetical protein
VRDFSLDMLKRLIVALRENGFEFVRFDAYWANRDAVDRREKVVLFRHDVDRFPKTALATAQLEARHGALGTYFFRVKPWTLKPGIIAEIAALGHEIGYHYETLADANGDFAAAAKDCEARLGQLREIAPVVSAAMHSRPLSKWDNRLLWDRHPLDDFGLLGETYRSIDHDRYVYLADSGRNWNADRNVIWDTVEGAEPVRMTPGTPGLIKAIEAGSVGSMQLLIHPNRWPRRADQWLFQFAQDFGINRAKDLIRWTRGRAQRQTAQ